MYNNFSKIFRNNLQNLKKKIIACVQKYLKIYIL